MNLGKRQVILAALILALGIAVYLNWQFSDEDNLIATNVVNSTKELGEAKYVNNSIKASDSGNSSEENNKSGDADKETNAEVDNGKNFFEQAKLNRQKAREEAADTVKDLLNDIKSSEEAKGEAVKQAAQIANNIQQESNIENLIKAKGCSDCLAFIQNGECSVVVNSGSLNENSAIIIKDIVSGQAGIDFDKIKITEEKS